jgi:DNA-binding protein HU-beta
MNKAELIEAITKNSKWSKAEVERVLDCTLDTIKKTVKKGDDVKLIGFGTFVRGKRKSRKGRNPQTGKTITIPACNYPKFKAGSEFKDLVR